MERKKDINQFYALIKDIERRYGRWNYSELINKDKKNKISEAGVYFFFEPGEFRKNKKDGYRVVRVGTHRVNSTSKAILSQRLKSHFGAEKNGVGRKSIFRDHVGSALFGQDGWLNHSTDVSEQRHVIVSSYIRNMWFVALPVDDPTGPNSERRVIEMGAVGLLSNYGRQGRDVVDPPSEHWLGRRATTSAKPCDQIKESGLWNVDGVTEEGYDPAFLEIMRRRLP